MMQALAVADVAVVLLAGALLSRLGRLVRQPAVIGEIVAGIALGPSLLGLLPGHLDTLLFPATARNYLSVMAQIGLLLFMFTIGWELDFNSLGRTRWTIGSVALGGMVLPGLLAVPAAMFAYPHHSAPGGHHVPFHIFALYLATSMSITAFPVLARIVADGGLARTRVGVLVLGSAAMGDVAAWCLLAVVVALVSADGQGSFASVIGWSVVYIAAMVVVVRPALRWMFGRRRAGGLLSYAPVLVAGGVFLSSYATAWIGVHPIFGAFAFGLAMPKLVHERPEPTADGTPHGAPRVLVSAVLEPFKATSRLLLPVYFIVTGLSVDIGGLSGRDWADLGIVLLVACVGKVIGAAVPGRLGGLSWRESLEVGVLMNTRGLTELIVLNVGLSLGVLDARLFTVMVLMALVTTAAAGPALPHFQRARTGTQPAPAPVGDPEVVAAN